VRQFFNRSLGALAALAAALDAAMTLDFNTLHATSSLDAIYDTNFPAGSILEIRTGAPAGADNAAGGTLLASITLPATPWAAAGGTGSKAKNGTWSTTGSAAGTAASYRLKNSAGTKLEEGTVTATGGGGDMTLDNTSIAVGQAVAVNTYTRTV
jgi:hypothetical protein